MPNKKNLENKIMSEITSGKVVMKPRWYFIVGSILSFVGLIASFFTAVFFSNVGLFMLRHADGRGQWKIDTALASFPLWVPLVAIAGLLTGILLLRKYELSYRRNFSVIAIAMVVAVVVGGYLLDRSGINDVWSQRGPMRQLYEHIQPESSVHQYGRVRGRGANRYNY